MIVSMIKVLLAIILLVLFYLLGKTADLVVQNIRLLGRRLGLNVYFLGLLLGAFTTGPEMSVAINSSVKGVPSAAFGNLMGGLVVIFGLILGASAILNRKIKTNDDGKNGFGLVLFYLFLPLLLSLDGSLGNYDGLILIILYFFIVYYLYRLNRAKVHKNDTQIVASGKHSPYKNIFLAILGIVLLLIIANAILTLTGFLVASFKVSFFVIGLLLYALGTNLPEIIVTLHSFKNHLAGLAYAGLLGSALANVLVVGVLAYLNGFVVQFTGAFWILFAASLGLYALIFFFHRSKQGFTRAEGWVMAGVYFAFFACQLALLGAGS